MGGSVFFSGVQLQCVGSGVEAGGGHRYLCSFFCDLSVQTFLISTPTREQNTANVVFDVFEMCAWDRKVKQSFVA